MRKKNDNTVKDDKNTANQFVLFLKKVIRNRKQEFVDLPGHEETSNQTSKDNVTRVRVG